MRKRRRSLCGMIIRLHPAVFRSEFGREMLLDFEDALAETGFAYLCLDALLSLGRQWAVSTSSGAAVQKPMARPSLLSGQYVMVSQGGLRLLDLLRASALSVAFYLAVGFAAISTSTVLTEEWRQPMVRISPRVLAVFGVLATGVPAYSQISPDSYPHPSFEVVSIRPWQPGPDLAPPPPPDGAMASQNAHERVAPLGNGLTSDRVGMTLSARMLIALAYGLPPGSDNRILGGPDWMGSDTYEIQAKIEDSLFATLRTKTPPQQREEFALMEQSLLADRFKLKAHIEKREMPLYALVIAKGGPKLTLAKDGESTKLSLVDLGGKFQMTATAVALDTWIHSPFLLGRTVVDQTGLKGYMTFK